MGEKTTTLMWRNINDWEKMLLLKDELKRKNISRKKRKELKMRFEMLKKITKERGRQIKEKQRPLLQKIKQRLRKLS